MPHSACHFKPACTDKRLEASTACGIACFPSQTLYHFVRCVQIEPKTHEPSVGVELVPHVHDLHHKEIDGLVLLADAQNLKEGCRNEISHVHRCMACTCVESTKPLTLNAMEWSRSAVGRIVMRPHTEIELLQQVHRLANSQRSRRCQSADQPAPREPAGGSIAAHGTNSTRMRNNALLNT